MFITNTRAIGEIFFADLTEAQLQAQLGTGYILSDGRNVAGSAYAVLTGNSTVVDRRGHYIRGKNNGRNDGKEDAAGEMALGAYQVDTTRNHNHRWYDNDSYTTPSSYDEGGGTVDGINSPAQAGDYGFALTAQSNNSYPSGKYTQRMQGYISADNIDSGYALESRPRTDVSNCFIRIN